MAKPKLIAVSRTQGNNRALKEGVVKPETCDLAFQEIPVLVDGFRRMVRGLEFDVCEMAISTYVCAREHGVRFTALPVFLVRAFHHGAIVTGKNSPIRNPKDLEGKRVGVNRGYTVTTGMWARSILQHELGVDLKKITWTPSGDEHVAEYQPPSNVEPLQKGAKLADMVASGELPAAVGLEAEPDKGVVTLIPDPEEAGFRALKNRGLYPINHLVVVKDEVLAANPGLAADLFRAFSRSKQVYVDELKKGPLARPTGDDDMFRRVMEITGGDPLPFGIEPNQRTLQEFIGYITEQGIIRKPVDIKSLFHPETHNLVG